ncbi:MAG: hypothetical protein LLF28_02725 [Nitrospiraceae bacterium]|nr:hypothetical protein [Nitrospiraceae bacterium]
MVNKFFVVISGICSTASFYLAYMTIKTGDISGAWLFISFGLLFCMSPLIIFIRFLARKSRLFESIDKTLSEKPEPRTTFVPHWFIMTMIIAAGVLILAIIITPILFR